MSEPLKPKPASGLPILNATQAAAKDPVCGMSVVPERAAARVEHEGKSYYFCGVGCAERFRKEPARYLAAPGTAGMGHGTLVGIAEATSAAAGKHAAATAEKVAAGKGEETLARHAPGLEEGTGGRPGLRMGVRPTE